MDTHDEQYTARTKELLLIAIILMVSGPFLYMLVAIIFAIITQMNHNHLPSLNYMISSERFNYTYFACTFLLGAGLTAYNLIFDNKKRKSEAPNFIPFLLYAISYGLSLIIDFVNAPLILLMLTVGSSPILLIIVYIRFSSSLKKRTDNSSDEKAKESE